MAKDTSSPCANRRACPPYRAFGYWECVARRLLSPQGQACASDLALVGYWVGLLICCLLLFCLFCSLGCGAQGWLAQAAGRRAGSAGGTYGFFWLRPAAAPAVVDDCCFLFAFALKNKLGAEHIA